MNLESWKSEWESLIVQWVSAQLAAADSGHGMDHVRRVVANAIRIASSEPVSYEVLMPAVWLHDCVIVPKNSPKRSRASRMAAESAVEFLKAIQYPAACLDAISHCIVSHSFSAQVPCESLEARILQDADRLEAVGAIGIARCLMTGGAMNQRLFHPEDPFPVDRPPQDDQQSIDHFFAKLFKLPATMQTAGGRSLATERTKFMELFLYQLADELSVDRKTVSEAIARVFKEF
jgi:uncharacterized protein